MSSFSKTSLTSIGLPLASVQTSSTVHLTLPVLHAVCRPVVCHTISSFMAEERRGGRLFAGVNDDF